jgi:hypothetical protein
MSGSQQGVPSTKVMHASAQTGHVARVWTIPPIPQYDITTCWEACGRMLFFWKHRRDKNQQGLLAAYQQAAGKYLNDYARKNLNEERDFYSKRLGMKEANAQNPSIVEKYLQSHSPLVIRILENGVGHVMVLTGFSESNWYFVNPQVFNQAGDATQHTFGAHASHTDSNGNEVYDNNTVIKASGVYMNPNQSSWHAAVRHRPKDKLFAQLKPEFFYYENPVNK